MAVVYTCGVVVGWQAVAALLRVHDFLCGHLMFLPLFVLAALQLPAKIQTWLLYHNALSEGALSLIMVHNNNLRTTLRSLGWRVLPSSIFLRGNAFRVLHKLGLALWNAGVLVDTILKQARRSQQAEVNESAPAAVGVSAEVAAELRGLIADQQRTIDALGRAVLQQTLQPQGVYRGQGQQPSASSPLLQQAPALNPLAAGPPTAAAPGLAPLAFAGSRVRPPAAAAEVASVAPTNSSPQEMPPRLGSFKGTPPGAATGVVLMARSTSQTTLGENLVFRGAGPVG